MPDAPQVLSRAVTDFSQHLGQRSLKRLTSYLDGYYSACEDSQMPYPYDPLGERRLGDWVQNRIRLTSEHESRLNARAGFNPYAYARLIAQDESHMIASRWALESFVEHLALYRDGELSDTMETAMKTILKNILDRAASDDAES
ncbi:MAG: hypothetical protein AAGD25_32375 [Cyanobacteria bacterium P01_F01_bin.150]